MRSYQHQVSEHGTSCSHREPSPCGCDEVQSTEKDIYISGVIIKVSHSCVNCILMAQSIKVVVLKRVRVTMTSPNIDKSKALNQNGPKTDLPKVMFSSPTLPHIQPSFTEGA